MALPSFVANAQQSQVMTNPLNLTYLFEEREPVHRTCADPVIVLYHDKYFLFSSHAAGYSYSDNLRDWTHIFSKMPLVKEWAPAVMVYDDYIYYMGFGNKRIFRTKDPINDNWEEVQDPALVDKGDPDFFVDNDGRTYYLWGCSNGGPMQGQEFDPKTFKPLSDVVDIMPANGDRLGWEVPGDKNEKTNEKGWNEGVSMVHDGDYYYFFYATPGTEYHTYCSGAYVGKSPLGKFEPMVGSICHQARRIFHWRRTRSSVPRPLRQPLVRGIAHHRHSRALRTPHRYFPGLLQQRICPRHHRQFRQAFCGAKQESGF